MTTTVSDVWSRALLRLTPAFILACSASSPASYVHAQIHPTVRVAMRAMCFSLIPVASPAACVHVIRILLRRAYTEVVRVAARRVIARVKHVHSVRDGAYEGLIRNTVRLQRLHTDYQTPISVVVAAPLPFPAVVSAANGEGSEQPFFGWRIRPALCAAKRIAVAMVTMSMGRAESSPLRPRDVYASFYATWHVRPPYDYATGAAA